ncbi:MAG: hypothetical protein VX954_04350 [Candidatus Thermoplasmatota archaeon]|nr:hypothetical protein [Candidatus Thermoplasmatota archaeon]
MDAETGLGSGDEEEVSESLLSSARSVVRTCLQIRKEEDVLVITDPETSTIGKALYEEAARVTDRVLLVMMPKSQRPGKEPPAPVSEIMRQNRVIMIATQSSLTHTRARANASKAGARIISMPGISTELFESGGMTADYNALQREMSGMGSNFRRRRKVHVTSPAGTDVTFNIGARWILEDNGICNRPGQVSNLPAGRVFVLPLEGSMSGRIVIDGSWEGSVLGGNLSFSVDGGMVTGVDGESADDVNSIFEMAKASNRGSRRDLVRTVAEFGFGLNPRATRIVGSKLEDQVVRGTAYFGFGDNTAIGGSAAVGFHIRGVMKDPSVTLDDFSLIREGKITMA